MKPYSGFTLVEILVVISIIALLSAVIYGSFGGARETASNRALQTELKEIQLALELFKSQNGRYPGVDVATQPTCAAGLVAQQGGTRGASNCSGFINYIGNATTGYLSPEFMAQLPLARDSRNDACVISYRTDVDGSWYKLTAENCFAGAEDASGGIGEDEEFSRCPSPCVTCGGSAYDETAESFYESMAVYSFGGECQ